MPRVKSFRCRSPGQRILDIMAYHQSRLELSHKEFANKIAIPYETLLRREKQSEKFTVDELIKIANVCEMTLGDLVSGNINQQ